MITITPSSYVPTARIVNQDMFGPEHHYAVSWPDESGNWHYGWVPAAFIVRPMGTGVWLVKAQLEKEKGQIWLEPKKA